MSENLYGVNLYCAQRQQEITHSLSLRWNCKGYTGTKMASKLLYVFTRGSSYPFSAS